MISDLARAVEAVLFASEEPLAAGAIAERLAVESVEAALVELEDGYAGRGVNLVERGGRWHFQTAPDMAHLLRETREASRRLSRAALETLAIIAYHEPVSRAEIEAIRGVQISKGTLDVLIEAEWVAPAGRRQLPGRPLTYATTPGFLTHFGLNDRRDLPGLDDLRAAGLLDPVSDDMMTLEVESPSRRFGTWNKAVIAAGLEVANEVNISDDRLYENIMLLWEHYGRQPRRAELADPPSLISWGAYRRRFHSWMDALSQFVVFANAQDVRNPNPIEVASGHKTSRDPSLRLRFRVMKRDNFSCRACGATPALTLGLSLHVDHIKAWSHGGETIEDNLQTLCEACNFGQKQCLMNANPKWVLIL